ncbi:uncharacterized protein LOC110448700 [Mizuhopecten yessoensis]|uniref:Kyphoscoliosis peptidase n=1 Tax=Mizuhopecten yessoensis TaxID=6573 RepID=A0A210R5F3_MIZYE|nr:uncharacterized protein LOC110448700 [Mizuhopecten yessoensis]OWF56307.1 Kyphoscoliosis peptidase [Mizuhopecten yessoensis]
MGASSSTGTAASDPQSRPTPRNANNPNSTNGDTAAEAPVQTQLGEGKTRSKKAYNSTNSKTNTSSSKHAQQPTAFQKNKGKFNPGKSKKKEVDRLLPPKPTSTTKYSLLHDIDFHAVDQHAIDAPVELLMGSYFDLVEYLTDDNAWDDLVKCRVIFRWVTSYDITRMKIDVTPPPNSPLEYFSKIQCDLGSYPNLFYILCEIADIPCVVVEGINKSSMYKVGEPIDREDLKAQWNAVYIYDEWRLVDTFWGNMCAGNEMPEEWRDMDGMSVTTGNKSDISSINGDPSMNGDVDIPGREVTRQPTVLEGTNNLPTDEEISEAGTDRRFTDLTWKRYHKMIVNEHYFLTNPSEMISTHLPDEDVWQLLEEPIPFAEFEEQAFMRERFHQLDMKIADEIYDNCIIEALDGASELILTLPPERSKNYRFKYVLFRSHLSAEERTRLDILLDRFVIFEHLEDMLRFSFQFPIAGKFKLDIYGLDKTNPEISGYDLVCSYLLVANDAQNCIPLPDYPAIGWGPGITSQTAGIEAISHKESSILTEDGRLEIVIGGGEEHKLKMSLRNPFSDEANLDKYAILRWTGNDFIINTRLPKGGMYAMKLYAKNLTSKKGEHANVLNYLIKCYGKGLKNDPFPNINTGNIGANPACKNLGVRCNGCEDGMIFAKDGFAQVEFENKGDVDLSCELHTNVLAQADRMRVTLKNGNNKNWFYLDLPAQGEYSMNVYAQKKGQVCHDLHNSHAFLVQSTGRPIQEGTVGRVKNSNFWKDTSPVIAETIYTKQSEIAVPVPAGMENVLAFLEQKEADIAPSKENVEMTTELGVTMFKVILPKHGEYILHIYQQAEKVYLKSIGRYYIFRSNSVDVVEDDLITIMDAIREERVRVGQDVSAIDATNRALRDRKRRNVPVDEKIARAQKLFLSLESDDPAVIRQALSDMLLTQPDPANALVKKAKKLLRYKEAKIELNQAYKTRNLPLLEKAIVKAKSANTDKSLDMPLLLARRLRDRLRVLQRLSEGVRQADHKTMGELKTYDNPPAGVHNAVRAALLLLGHPLSESEKWIQCKTIMHQSENENLAQIMVNFEPKDVSIATAIEAKMMLEPYTETKMREISPGATGVFIWVKSMIKEIEASVGTLKERKPKPKRPVIIQPKFAKPTKKYVTITMDMLNKPPPLTTEGLFDLGERTYQNAYKRRKLKGLSFPVGHPANGRKGGFTVISDPHVDILSVGSEKGKKNNVSPVNIKSKRRTMAHANSDKTRRRTSVEKEKSEKRTNEKKDRRQSDPDPSSKSQPWEPDSHDFQKIEVKELHRTGAQYTPDSELLNGFDLSNGSGANNSVSNKSVTINSVTNPQNAKVDKEARKAKRRQLRKSYSEPRITEPGSIVDRHSYLGIHNRETHSEIPIKPMKVDPKLVNFKGTSGYAGKYELRKSYNEAIKVSGLPN